MEQNGFQAQVNGQDNFFIEEQKQSAVLGFLGWLIAIVVFFAFLAAYLSQHIYVMSINKELNALERKMTEIRRENEHLQIALAAKINMETIEKDALSRVGMIKPNQVKYIVWNKR